ncbi:MAG: tryptophan synthase subunit alpha [Polyangiaceae bacterium]
MLEAYIAERKKQSDLLLMTHIVIGYPSLAASLEIVDAMVEAGVDLMELQVPFSEPIADGPVILKANQESLRSGIRVDDCFRFAETVCARHAIPFLFMGYYNTLVARGVDAFVARAKSSGLRGAIVPDLPPEEGAEYLSAMQRHSLDPIFIFSPNSPDERMQEVAKYARGFVYCVARKGVTGSKTQFSDDSDRDFGSVPIGDVTSLGRWFWREGKNRSRTPAWQGRHRRHWFGEYSRRGQPWGFCGWAVHPWTSGVRYQPGAQRSSTNSTRRAKPRL